MDSSWGNETKTDAAEGGDRDAELFVEMIGYSGRDLHWSYQQNKNVLPNYVNSTAVLFLGNNRKLSNFHIILL